MISDYYSVNLLFKLVILTKKMKLKRIKHEKIVFTLLVLRLRDMGSDMGSNLYNWQRFYLWYHFVMARSLRIQYEDALYHVTWKNLGVTPWSVIINWREEGVTNWIVNSGKGWRNLNHYYWITLILNKLEVLGFEYPIDWKDNQVLLLTSNNLEW